MSESRTLGLLAGSLIVAACSRDPAAATSPMPWVHNFSFEAATATPNHAVPQLLDEWRHPDPECAATSYGGLEIATATQKIAASYTQGVFVFDGNRHLVANTAPFTCAGSADELEALAVGKAGTDQPLVLVAVTRGGHRESVTWLYAFRVADQTLEPVFAQPVEQHEGEDSHAGAVSFGPGSLVYRAPSGHLSLWTYDSGRYVASQSLPSEQGNQ